MQFALSLMRAEVCELTLHVRTSNAGSGLGEGDGLGEGLGDGEGDGLGDGEGDGLGEGEGDGLGEGLGEGTAEAWMVGWLDETFTELEHEPESATAPVCVLLKILPSSNVKIIFSNRNDLPAEHPETKKVELYSVTLELPGSTTPVVEK